jgi:hypothetical protein
MAHGTITLINPQTEEIKLAPVGYSWTTLCWGFFPTLFRQDWKNAAIIFGVLLATSFFFASWIALIVFSFIYNDKMHLKDKLNSGWKIKSYVGSKSIEIVGQSVGYNLEKFMVDPAV